MRRRSTDGFTIIEVLLFLAITGLLVAGVLSTTSGTINSQRYKDSVSSLKSMLQMQYSNSVNIDNQRNDNPFCADGSGASAAGQSKCVVLGKIIRLNSAKKSFTSRYVISNGAVSADDFTLDSVGTDKEAFDKYGIGVLSETILAAETYDIEWGSQIDGIKVKSSAATVSDGSDFTMLVLRSPLNGAIRTYIGPTGVADENHLMSFINAATTLIINDNNHIDLCVNSNGLISGGIKMTAVRINTNASSASGIETIGDNASDNGCGL